MRAFFAIKYYNDSKNNELVENIINTLKKIDIDVFALVNCKLELTAQELMKTAFEEIDKSDIFLIEASEPSIGIGIEAGYAYMKNKPIYLIANKNAYVSDSIKGISNKVVIYDNIEDLFKLKD